MFMGRRADFDLPARIVVRVDQAKCQDRGDGTPKSGWRSKLADLLPVSANRQGASPDRSAGESGLNWWAAFGFIEECPNRAGLFPFLLRIFRRFRSQFVDELFAEVGSFFE